MLRALAGWTAIALLGAFAPLIAADNGREISPDRAVADYASPPSSPMAGTDTISNAAGDVTPGETALAASLIASVAQSPPITLVVKADLGAQQVTVLEGDTVLDVWPISSGVQGYATPTGIFQPQWASRLWYSRQWGYAPMPHAVFFNNGVAFHGTNATWRLGKSASHGCLRLSPANAKQLFMLVHKHGFAQTRVIVYGTPKHGPPPSPAVARRARPAPTFAATPPKGMPDWAKTLFFN